MSYALLWIEILAACLLYMATDMAAAARAKTKWRRRLLTGMGLAGPLLIPMGLFELATGMILLHFGIGGAAFWWCVSLSVGYATGAILIWQRAFQPDAAGVPRAVSWRPRRIWGTFGMVCLILLMTLWNRMLQSEIEVQAIRARAGAMALAASTPRVLDSEDAGPLYDQLNIVYKAAQAPGDETVDYQQLDGASPQLSAYLDRQEKSLDLARRAADLPGCNSDTASADMSEAIKLQLPQLGAFRTASNLLCAAARHEAATGRVSLALMDCRRSYAVAGQVLGRSNMLIGGLVDVAVDQQTSRTIADVLPHVTTREQVAGFKVDPPDGLWRDYARCLQMEEAYGTGSFCDFAAGEGQFTKVPAALGALNWEAWLKEDFGIYRQFMEETEKSTGEAYYKGASERAAREQSYAQHPRGILSPILMPSMNRATQHVADAAALRLAAAEARGATLYHLDHAGYPDAADALVPEYLAAVPTDPFDGKPMHFKKRDDGSIVIYSVGPNLKDDGGDVERKDKHDPADAGIVLRPPSPTSRP